MEIDKTWEVHEMTLEVDKKAMTIMGVRFDNRADFRGVWYVMSSSMIEGWLPKIEDVEEMKNYIESKRQELSHVKKTL